MWKRDVVCCEINRIKKKRAERFWMSFVYIHGVMEVCLDIFIPVSICICISANSMIVSTVLCFKLLSRCWKMISVHLQAGDLNRNSCVPSHSCNNPISQSDCSSAVQIHSTSFRLWGEGRGGRGVFTLSTICPQVLNRTHTHTHTCLYNVMYTGWCKKTKTIQQATVLWMETLCY